MHRDSSTYTTPDGKTYTRHLLRESYRSGGKVLTCSIHEATGSGRLARRNPFEFKL